MKKMSKGSKIAEKRLSKRSKTMIATTGIKIIAL